jgi:hypothetical protein
MQALMISFRHEYSTQFASVEEKLTELGFNTRWPQATSAPMHYECLYLAGGGSVGATGDMAVQILHKSTRCKAVFDWYFSNVRTLCP